jgi:hypothetical protein
MVLSIPRVAVMGLRRRIKYVFPGGWVCGTAMSWFVSTTISGATAPTGADLPLAVSVFFETLSG